MQLPGPFTEERHPFVLDSTTLRDNLIHTHFRGADGTSLLFGARFGSTNLFAPDHIFKEVEEHLEEWAAQKGLDAVDLRQVWERDYLPLIRFVNVSNREPGDRRVARITSDDLPCGLLAELTGPTHVLTADKHLVKYGVGEQQWLIRTRQSRDVATGDAVVRVGGMTFVVSTDIAVEAGKHFVRAVREIDPLILLAVVLIGAYLFRRYVESGKAKQHLEATRRGATFLAETFGPVIAESATAKTELTKTAFTPESQSLIQSIGRTLATAQSGLTIRQLAWQLGREDHEPLNEAALEQLLRRTPAFVETPAGFWWLGCLRAPASASRLQS